MTDESLTPVKTADDNNRLKLLYVSVVVLHSSLIYFMIDCEYMNFIDGHNPPII